MVIVLFNNGEVARPRLGSCVILIWDTSALPMDLTLRLPQHQILRMFAGLMLTAMPPSVFLPVPILRIGACNVWLINTAL